MPDYAAVYLDDVAKTYVALPCLKEWQNRRNQTLAMLRLNRASEAYALKYEPDEVCRETGAFSEDDRSLIGLLLVKLGILAPIQHWWDAPYRTEQGVVVHPR